MKSGTLYGIGVGPGDPDMITLKAIAVLGKVDVVFAASSSKNKHSLAVDIARPHLGKDAPVRMLSFPMTKDKDSLSEAWKENARSIIAVLEQGKDAAFLTLGDCMTYSTFGYIVNHMKAMAPHLEIVSIPGITSYQAAAARLNTPLVEGEESLMVLSGVHGGGHLRKFSHKPDNVVFMKAYKNAGDIAQALDEAGMDKSSKGVIKCGLPDEQVVTDINEFKKMPPDYWTLIIAKKNSVSQDK